MATYQQWSQSYFVNDTSRDDIVVADLTPDGQLYVPCLDKSFNKLGEEVHT